MLFHTHQCLAYKIGNEARYLHRSFQYVRYPYATRVVPDTVIAVSARLDPDIGVPSEVRHCHQRPSEARP
jgi:hypothetical protein